MNFKTVYSTHSTAAHAVEDLQQQLTGFNARMVLFFASSHFDPKAISHQMYQAFPSASTFGCSTSGEITSGRMLDNALVAMAFSERVIADLKVEVATQVREDDAAVKQAFAGFERHFGQPMSELNPEQ